MVLRSDVFFFIFFFDVIVEILWKISIKVYNLDNRRIKFIKGVFFCVRIVFMEYMERKLGFEEWEGFR